MATKVYVICRIEDNAINAATLGVFTNKKKADEHWMRQRKALAADQGVNLWNLKMEGDDPFIAWETTTLNNDRSD